MFSYNINELKNLMQSLYTLSGIRFIVFDSDRNKLVSYPDTDCEFCTLMKSNEEWCEKCLKCDNESFALSETQKSLVIYKCHAGLVEATVALRENSRIIGYLMFGQVSDEPDSHERLKNLAEYCENIGFNNKDIILAASQIQYKDEETIKAATKIMEACAGYILLKELIQPENSKIVQSVREFTEMNINRIFCIDEICKEFDISRTKLYEAFKNETSLGVSEYIRQVRLKKARELLKTTDLSVSRIAEDVGFFDYNYFSRVYKKHYGKSPKSYRK